MPRKEIKLPDVKKLFALSGNICTYPDCNQKMVDEDNVVIGRICHIEAAEENGPRFNDNSNDEERRSFDNLILLCPNHHVKIDNDPSFTVSKLKQMKADQRKKFEHKPYNPDFEVIARAIHQYETHFNQITTDNEIGTQINIQANQVNYQGQFKDEEELSIVDEIFEYVMKKIEVAKKEDKGKEKPEEKPNLADKIKLNFKNQEEQEEVDKYTKNALLKRKLIETKYQSLAIDDSEKQKDLHNHIFGLYKVLKRTGLGNIDILTALFKEFTPKDKSSNSTYVNLSKALVLFFFEDCTIFEKTKAEKQVEFELRKLDFES